MPQRPDRGITPPPRLLVVDDEPVVRDLVRETLAFGTFQLSFATDGADALEQASRDRPALVLLDLDLGGALDGLEVCRRLERPPRGPQVILLTGNIQHGTREACLDAGAAAYVTKPFSPLELLKHIERALERAA